MNRENNISEEVNKTIQLLDEPKKIESNPFFYTRVKAKIDEMERGEEQNYGWQIIAIFAKSFLIFFLFVLNIVTIRMSLLQNESNNENREHQLQNFAIEYDLESKDNSFFQKGSN